MISGRDATLFAGYGIHGRWDKAPIAIRWAVLVWRQRDKLHNRGGI